MRTQAEVDACIWFDKLTQAQLNKIKFVDDAIKNMLSPEQEYAIEKKQHEKRLADREIWINNKLNRKWPREIWINSEKKYMTENELTEEIIENEVEFWVYIHRQKKDS